MNARFRADRAFSRMSSMPARPIVHPGGSTCQRPREPGRRILPGRAALAGAVRNGWQGGDALERAACASALAELRYSSGRSALRDRV